MKNRQMLHNPFSNKPKPHGGLNPFADPPHVPTLKPFVGLDSLLPCAFI